MIHPDIINLVQQLTQKTRDKNISWDYDYEDNSVSLNLARSNLIVNLRYRFDENYESGRFIMHIILNSMNYFFDAIEKLNQDDYFLLKNLYDLAQGSRFSQDFVNLKI